MHIKEIDAKNFMVHKETSISLPDRGIVLITGVNWSGKSSIVEMVATALWGETLRGEDPWSEESGSAKVKTDSIWVERRFKKKKMLEWGQEGSNSNGYSFETPTKAQEALEKIIGSFDIWRRTRVFSSQDACHFTLATDAERKRLLESILGLDRFDDALSACREDKRTKERDFGGISISLSNAQAKLESELVRVSDAKKMLENTSVPVDVKELKKKRDGLTLLLGGIEKDLRSLKNEEQKAAVAGVEEKTQYKELERRLDDLSGDNCDRCGQSIPDSIRTPLRDEIARLRDACGKARKGMTEQMESVHMQMDDLSSERDTIQKTISTLDSQLLQSSAESRRYNTAKDVLDAAERSVETLQKEILNLSESCKVRGAEMATLQVVEQVLGLKGVRAHVLGKSLSGLEQAANFWLSRISNGELALELQPYTQKKTGGVSDSLCLKVRAPDGKWRTYRAASGGQRRRIDVSLIFALAEISQAAYGEESGTIFADECFDALDDAGVSAISEVLQEMAQKNAVVVISHNENFNRILHPVKHLHVEAGKVIERSRQ